MNKKQLFARDIRITYITPALEKAGWDVTTQIREEFPLAKGRIIVRGKLHTRAKHKRADYALFYKPNIPIAIIEAKDNNHTVGDGMQQALGYADMLQVPFLFNEGTKTNLKRELLEEFNLHTIVRLPKGLFSPYTSIATNILFFEKGGPTNDVWFFAHPYPDEYQSYSRSKPLTIAEFDLEKGWWGGAERKGRKTTEQAWKVSAKDLAERNYNLDCKNPHEVEVNPRDPEELMVEYRQIVHQFEAAQPALKSDLMACLRGKA